jgi:integrase
MITPRSRTDRDGNVTWQVPFRLDRKQTSETFVEYQGAVRFAKLIDEVGPAEARRIVKVWAGASRESLSLAGWATEHVDSLTGVQDDTIKRYQAYIRNDLGRLGHLPLDAITVEAVGAWVKAIEKTGASGKTIKNKHGFLSAVMEHAVASKHVPANPCKGTRLPRTITEPMVFLTHDEYARFVGFVVPYWQPLVTTLFSTGLRWGEVTALRVGDVDLEQATATVVQAWKRDRTLGPPKSSKSRRTISLAPETVALLRPLVAARPADAYVFTNTHGGPVRHQAFHDNVWQPAVRLANGEPAKAPGPKGKRVAKRRGTDGKIIQPATLPLGKRPRIHDARHTCASWLLGAGVPINYVQAHLGHESITTTVDRYGHVMPAARQAIAGAMSFALTQAHPQIEPSQHVDGDILDVDDEPIDDVTDPGQ